MIVVSVVIAAIGWMIAKNWIWTNPKAGERVRDSQGVRPLYNMMGAKWYIDELYAWLFTKPGKAFSDWLWKFVDGAKSAGEQEDIRV